MRRLVSGGACFALLLMMMACGGESTSTESAPSTQSGGAATSSRPSGNGVCGLMMQAEVDELFGTGVGAGVEETLEGGVQICSWPSGADPSLLLQVGPAGGDIRAAVDLGDGYRVVDLEEMSGPAAAAIEDADGPDAVILVALATGDKTVTVSPVGLGIADDSPKFDTLKALVDLIATRL